LALAALLPRTTWYLLYRILHWPQVLFGCLWKIRPHQDSIPGLSSMSLDRQHYPRSYIYIYTYIHTHLGLSQITYSTFSEIAVSLWSLCLPILDFKLSLCLECCICSFGYLPGVRLWSISSIFKGSTSSL